MREETIKGLLYIQELNKKNFEVLLKKLLNVKNEEWTVEKEKELTQDKAMIIETIINIEKNLTELEEKLQILQEENKIKGEEKNDKTNIQE